MRHDAHPAKSDSKAEPMARRGQNRSHQKEKPLIDPSLPLPSARHEAFAQAVVDKKTDVEAYRIAGFKAKEPHKRACEIRAIPGIKARIAHLRAEIASKSMLTKERAMKLNAEMAEGLHGAEPHHRIAAMKLVGSWCGWEKGTQAEQAAAKALGGVADMMTRIRTRKSV